MVLNFEVPYKEFDLMGAVKKAALDYCLTDDGKQTFERNCDYFNWADFAVNVPNSFCQKHGFQMIESPIADQIVNWDEQLVDEEDIYRDEEVFEEEVGSLDEQIVFADGLRKDGVRGSFEERDFRER